MDGVGAVSGAMSEPIAAAEMTTSFTSLVYRALSEAGTLTQLSTSI